MVPMTPRTVLMLVGLLIPACASTPDVGEGLRDRARVAEAQKRWVAAAQTWNELLEASQGQSAEAARGLARSLAARGDSAGALRVLEAGSRVSSATGGGDAPLLMDLGALLQTLGRLDQACSAYLDAVEADPQGALPAQRAGQALMSAGRAREAAEVLLAASRLEPDHGPTWVLLARAHSRLGEIALALAAYRQAASAEDLDPADAVDVARFVLANPTLTGWADLVELARERMRALSASAPNDGLAHRLWGALELAAGRPEDGLPPLRRAAELDPGDVDALLLLARACLDTGRMQEARRVTQHGLDLKPGWGGHPFFLALLVRIEAAERARAAEHEAAPEVDGETDGE